METDEVKVTVLDEAPASYLLKCNGLTASFPKSEVSFKRRNVKTGDAVAEIPLWLLKDRGWDKPGTGSNADGMPDLTED